MQAVLNRGKRLNRADFEIRFLTLPAECAAGDSKIAISVSKRLLKSSVARNRIKRLVREAYRGHRAAATPLHMLVSYKGRSEGRDAAARRSLRMELANLFNDAILRVQSGNSRLRAG